MGDNDSYDGRNSRLHEGSPRWLDEFWGRVRKVDSKMDRRKPHSYEPIKTFTTFLRNAAAQIRQYRENVLPYRKKRD